MRYQIFQPNHHLAKYVECFWTLESRGKLADTTPENILPDGCVELIFNLADPFKRYHANDKIEIQPPALIAGQMQHHALIKPAGRVKLFGVRFHPGGAYPFLHLPIHELTDRIISFESICSRMGRELTEKIQAARSLRERINIIEATFIARLDPRHDAEALVNAVINLIVQRDGLVSIDHLHKTIGLSDRQLERKFQTQVGICFDIF